MRSREITSSMLAVPRIEVKSWEIHTSQTFISYEIDAPAAPTAPSRRLLATGRHYYQAFK